MFGCPDQGLRFPVRAGKVLVPADDSGNLELNSKALSDSCQGNGTFVKGELVSQGNGKLEQELLASASGENGACARF